MSALEEAILEELRDLPAEQQQEVLKFTQKLKQRRKGQTLSIWDKIDNIVEEIPPEAWDTVPSDGSINVDHYLYGAPKKR